MELQQVNTLKLNAKKINSVLIRGNNNVKKLKADEKNLLLKISDQNKKAEEERKVESKGGTNFPGKGLLGKVAQPVMSIFDKLKQFFGSILLGILIEELPKAIAAAQKFFDDNPWIIPTVKNIFKFLGKTLMGMIDLVNFIKPGVIFAFEKTRDAVIGALNLFGIETDALLGNDIKSAEDAVDSLDDGSSNTPVADPEPVAEGPESQQSNPTIPASGITPASSTLQPPSPGPEAVKSSASTPDSSTQASKSGSQTPNSDLESGPKKGFKYGGMFIPSQYSKMTTNRRGRKISGRRTQIVQETGSERKAREALSSYSDFFTNMQIASELNAKQEENNESFEKFFENYKKVSLGERQTGDTLHGQSSRPGSSRNMPADDPDDAVYSTDAGAPSNFPGTSRDYNEWRSYYNNGRGGYHQGEDYGVSQGTPITMLVGGEVIDSGVGAGIGGNIYIKHPDGTYTRYLHLSKRFVEAGDTVEPGTVIGLTGGDRDIDPVTAGFSSGPHLHLEYYPSEGTLADPFPYADKYFIFGRRAVTSSSGDTYTVSGVTYSRSTGRPISGGSGGDLRSLRSYNMNSSNVVYIIQPMVAQGSDTILIRNIDRPMISRSKSRLRRPSLA